jgi:hypothetical protein
MMTDEQIDALVPQYFGADRFNFGPSRYREFARALLSASKPAVTQSDRIAGPFEFPVVIDRCHPNQAYVTYGFGDEEACTQFIKATQRGNYPAAPAQSGDAVEADVVPNEIAELLTEPCWNLSRRDVSDLLKRIGSILYTAPQSSQPVEAGEGETS